MSGWVAPTQSWLSAAAWLPELEGSAAVAERLLLLVHYGVDWDGWVGDRRATYWDQLLPQRVLLATYRARDLRGWWTILHRSLETAPRTADQRRELDFLLGQEPRPVLAVLRDESEALLLRTRLVADAVRSRKVDRVEAAPVMGGVA